MNKIRMIFNKTRKHFVDFTRQINSNNYASRCNRKTKLTGVCWTIYRSFQTVTEHKTISNSFLTSTT